MIYIFQDDMIDDVDAFVKVAEVLKERGAYKIYVMATHGLLSSDAPKLLEESCIDEVDFFFCNKINTNERNLNFVNIQCICNKSMGILDHYNIRAF